MLRRARDGTGGRLLRRRQLDAGEAFGAVDGDAHCEDTCACPGALLLFTF